MINVDLPSRQAPLKEKYRKDPKAALVTFRSRGRLAEGICCDVPLGSSEVRIGLNAGVGGSDSAVCPADMLLGSIASCLAVTMKAVAAHLGIDIRGGTVRAEGDLDLRGTLAVAEDAPIGFTQFSVTVDLDTDAPEDQVKTLLATAEKYAVVLQTLASSPRIRVIRG